MSKTNLEYERGGFLYDQYKRKELAFRELNSAELTTDNPEGGTVKDVDGRELVIPYNFSPITGVQSVKDPQYGAKGDGVTDDTKAFEKAITGAGEHGALFMPKGEYVISKALSIPYERFSLLGIGYRSSTIKLANGSNSPVITTPDDKVQRYGLLLKDFGIEANAANQTGEEAAINIRGMNEARVEGLYILEPRGAAIRIGQATAGIFNTVPMITRCVIRGDKVNSQTHGIALESGSSDAQVIGCDIGYFTNGAGILVSGHAGYELIGNQCWQDKNGYQIFQGGRGRLIGCLSDLSKQHGIVVQNANDTQLIGCQSRESGQTKSNEYDGIIVEGTEAAKECLNTVIVGCRAMGLPTRHGLNIHQYANKTQVIGCDFDETVEGGFIEGATGVKNTTLISNPTAGTKMGYDAESRPVFSKVATTATAGNKGAVPAEVNGYLEVVVEGTTFKVPYYKA